MRLKTAWHFHVLYPDGQKSNRCVSVTHSATKEPSPDRVGCEEPLLVAAGVLLIWAKFSNVVFLDELGLLSLDIGL